MLLLLLSPMVMAQQLPGPGLRPRGRIRISDMQLPPGPAPAPAMNWPSFGALPATSTVHTHIPLLREPQSSTSNTPKAGQDAVVYGNWKPDHPQRPEEDDEKDMQRPKERVYGRLEAMLMGMHTDEIDQQPRRSSEEEMEAGKTSFAPSSYHNSQSRRDSFERSPEITPGHGPHGRRRISNNPSTTQFEVLKMNATDPLMKAMANQINESVETTTIGTNYRKHQSSSTDDNWMPLPYPYPSRSYDNTLALPGPSVDSTSFPAAAPTIQVTQSTAAVSLNWPKDFLDNSSVSTEPVDSDKSMYPNIDRRDENAAEMHYDDEDSLNSAQMHSELSIPETIVPQLPLNITRVGIPYEERNSAEEPTICVPLTVSETSLSSDSSLPLVVEVERVYCFPLPKVEVRTGSVKQITHTPTTSSSPSEMDMEVTPKEQTTPAADATAAGSQRTPNPVHLFFLALFISILCRK
ncbi:uncharacterized protein Dwil_GK21913 [Drosophila willistoni]|nr:uncharacterized protein Dwil_GK21913 [Drosophila willistoni]